MGDLVKSIRNFATRDFVYLLGGAGIIASFLCPRWTPSEILEGLDMLPGVVLALLAGLAWMLGYAAQDVMSLTRYVSTRYVTESECSGPLGWLATRFSGYSNEGAARERLGTWAWLKTVVRGSEKEAGEKKAGEKKAGEKKAGEKEAGEKEAGGARRVAVLAHSIRCDSARSELERFAVLIMLAATMSSALLASVAVLVFSPRRSWLLILMMFGVSVVLAVLQKVKSIQRTWFVLSQAEHEEADGTLSVRGPHATAPCMEPKTTQSMSPTTTENGAAVDEDDGSASARADTA